MSYFNVIIGQPGAGKTAWVIKTANSFCQNVLIVSPENSKILLIERGLEETIPVLRRQNLTTEHIICKCKLLSINIIIIDNLDLLPQRINLTTLQDKAKDIGVIKIYITAHILDQMTPISNKRLKLINHHKIYLT